VFRYQKVESTLFIYVEMKTFLQCVGLAAAAATCLLHSADAFVLPHGISVKRIPFIHQTSQETTQEEETKTCFYRAPISNQWQPRINVNDLKIGQHLNGTVVQELLDGTTGPKLFLDCGVGRIDAHGDWQICNGMMRLGGRGNKISVTRKRATRLRRKALVEVIVSRVYPESARFEVITEDTALEEPPQLVPASSLQPNQELVGTVTKVMPFGVFVDVGANRKGLLHIQKVADLYQRYIDKEKGLEEAGLERGARIRVAVLSNEHKRLFLDFTDDVKQSAQEEAKQEEAEAVVTATVATAEEALSTAVKEEQDSDDSTESSYGDLSEEEAAAWAAYGAMGEESEQDYIDNEEYDEDRDIEDALGLGSY